MRPFIAAMLILGTVLAAPAQARKGAGSTASTVQTQYVQVGPDRIAFRTLGEGAPILMANRFRGTLDTWDPLFLDALAKHHTLVFFDYPGIGYSQGTLPDRIDELTRFIDAFATAIGVQQFTLLGWSWGGLAAQAYAIEHPDRAKQLVLIATHPPGKLDIPLQKVFLDRAVKPVNDLDDEVVLFFEPRSVASRAAAKASHDRIYRREGAVDRIPARQEQFTRYFSAAGEFHQDAADRRGALAQLETPMLVISGDHDTSTAGQNWFPLVGMLKNAQLIFYSQSGHAPQHQYPERTAGYIAKFLASPPANGVPLTSAASEAD